MSVSLSVDRFEGDDDAIAVVVTDEGQSFNIPRSLLPEATEAGEVLQLTFKRDAQATAKLKKEAHSIQEELAERDPGGDVTL